MYIFIRYIHHDTLASKIDIRNLGIRGNTSTETLTTVQGKKGVMGVKQSQTMSKFRLTEHETKFMIHYCMSNDFFLHHDEYNNSKFVGKAGERKRKTCKEIRFKSEPIKYEACLWHMMHQSSKRTILINRKPHLWLTDLTIVWLKQQGSWCKAHFAKKSLNNKSSWKSRHCDFKKRNSVILWISYPGPTTCNYNYQVDCTKCLKKSLFFLALFHRSSASSCSFLLIIHPSCQGALELHISTKQLFF